MTEAQTPIRVLLVEDSVADAELVLRELRAGGFAFEHVRVDTRQEWEDALESGPWDVVLLDYVLPQLDTLSLLRELSLALPGLPAIVVSGTITEESAVSALRAGARDFITKQNMVRLVPAIRRELVAAADARERLAAEAALGESEARFARLVENGQDVVMRISLIPTETFEYVSPSAKAVTGYAPEEFYADAGLGRRLIHPEDRAAVEASYAEDPERPVIGRAVTADGRTIWLDRRQVAIRDGEGTIVALESVARDVTQQVLAHEELRAREHNFRAIFEGALDAVLLADDHRVYLDANPAAAELLGIPRDEIVGKRVEDFARSTAPGEIAGAWTAFLEAGRQEGEIEVFRPDGEIRTTDFRATANVKPGVHLSILRDVTDRNQAQSALQESEERVHAMLAELPLVVFTVPVDGGGPSWVSPQTEALLGLPVEAWGANPELFWDAVHPDDLAQVQASQARDSGALDFRLRPADGRELLVHGQHRHVRDADGTVTHYHGFLLDITELADSRDALAASESRLRQAQKMEAIGQLAGGVAHDFNNLLTVINGYGDLALARCGDDDQLRSSVTEIRRAGNRAAELTHQLLAFSRQQVLIPEVMDVNDVVSEHASMLSRLLGEDVQLHVTLNARNGYVAADPGQLAQVILNLAGNARDAMPSGGDLAIRTETAVLDAQNPLGLEPGKYVALEVQDSGCGIDLQTQAHVFEPFFTTKEIGKGTGLGLSTVLGIVEQSRGRVVVESEPGEGTTFRIYLPRVDAPLPAEPPDEPQPERAFENVLLVEDDLIVRTLVAEILGGRGYNVLATGSPAAALETCESYEGEIQLLVTDVIMPEMNGRELATQIQALRPGIRTLYMSGYTNDSVIARGVLPEGMLFLQKPFTASQLGAKARQALDRPAPDLLLAPTG